MCFSCFGSQRAPKFKHYLKKGYELNKHYKKGLIKALKDGDIEGDDILKNYLIAKRDKYRKSTKVKYRNINTIEQVIKHKKADMIAQIQKVTKNEQRVRDLVDRLRYLDLNSTNYRTPTMMHTMVTPQYNEPEFIEPEIPRPKITEKDLTPEPTLLFPDEQKKPSEDLQIEEQDSSDILIEDNSTDPVQEFEEIRQTIKDEINEISDISNIRKRAIEALKKTPVTFKENTAINNQDELIQAFETGMNDLSLAIKTLKEKLDSQLDFTEEEIGCNHHHHKGHHHDLHCSHDHHTHHHHDLHCSHDHHTHHHHDLHCSHEHHKGHHHDLHCSHEHHKGHHHDLHCSHEHHKGHHHDLHCSHEHHSEPKPTPLKVDQKKTILRLEVALCTLIDSKIISNAITYQLVDPGCVITASFEIYSKKTMDRLVRTYQKPNSKELQMLTPVGIPYTSEQTYYSTAHAALITQCKKAWESLSNIYEKHGWTTLGSEPLHGVFT